MVVWLGRERLALYWERGGVLKGGGLFGAISTGIFRIWSQTASKSPPTIYIYITWIVQRLDA